MSNQTCKVCGALLAVHRVAIIDGVAHTIGANARQCSRADADRLWLLAKATAFGYVVRSLTNRAARLSTRGAQWGPMNLFAYAEHWQKERDRAHRAIERHHAWSERP